MTVNDLCNVDGFKPVAVPDGERVINGVYIGDLLSWVMSRACKDNAWITIMSNINTVAVASLTDVSVVILAEGVIPDSDVLTTATQKGINFVCSSLPSYETATLLFELLK